MIETKAGATKAGGVERWLPWTEMRHTNKTEISLAAMALVVTGTLSVHNHRALHVLQSFTGYEHWTGWW